MLMSSTSHRTSPSINQSINQSLFVKCIQCTRHILDVGKLVVTKSDKGPIHKYPYSGQKQIIKKIQVKKYYVRW